ncbi:uncharacterized protein LOC113564260 [Drosophila erecta]|uniref:uncharacterized protein LOC113564260 n=1 Tax=Drosophila erecta TaxID=7220 RepID=UPI0001780BC7|nr:uncharacterized protein LOC113564260 [Drosophila erecta]
MEGQKAENNSADDAIRPTDSAPALNVLCSVCKEFFRANDNVCHSNRCGHAFHSSCLSRWLSRSLTCPQCRTACGRSASRLYLNFAQVTETCDDPPSDDKFYKMDEHFEWRPMELDEDSRSEYSHLLSDEAVQCGFDDEGNPAYVARAYFDNDRLPAHYVPRKKVAFGGWNGLAYALTDGVELLVLKDCDHQWVDGTNGSYPQDALPTGYSHWGEVTYTGRALYKGVLRLGKVHPSYNRIFIPHKGKEVGGLVYEVLVLTPREPAVQSDT